MKTQSTFLLNNNNFYFRIYNQGSVLEVTVGSNEVAISLHKSRITVTIIPAAKESCAD